VCRLVTSVVSCSIFKDSHGDRFVSFQELEDFVFSKATGRYFFLERNGLMMHVNRTYFSDSGSRIIQ
jgi:hypothetical protein